MKIKCIYIGENTHLIVRLMRHEAFSDTALQSHPFRALEYLHDNQDVQCVVIEASDNSKQTSNLIATVKQRLPPAVPIVVIAHNHEQFEGFKKSGADDVFLSDFDDTKFFTRVKFLIESKSQLLQLKRESIPLFKIPVWKRIFDIVFSSIAILCFLPFFIIIVIAIRIESKGRVIYWSKRVGVGYKVFNFYKFRSMYSDADKRVDQLMKQNQYGKTVDKSSKSNSTAPENSSLLIADDGAVSETEYLTEKGNKQETAFFKMANDPRITKVGRLLRNTSIDELPQLFNVLKGDMSVVGNRPLPLYEAELLTTDEWIQRFNAPAGLTGIWQIKKRGGANKMSADERKQLDIEYANGFSFWGDLLIILKTLPAMLQHENV